MLFFFFSCQVTSIDLDFSNTNHDTNESDIVDTQTEDTNTPEDTGIPEDTGPVDYGPFLSFSLEPTAMPLVLQTQWSAETPLKTRAVFETETGRIYTTPWDDEPLMEGNHILFGIPADSMVSVYLEAEVGDSIDNSQTETFSMPALPSNLVTPTRYESQIGAISGFVVVPLISLDKQYLLILDGDGAVVWYKQLLKWTMRGRLNHARTDTLHLENPPGARAKGTVVQTNVSTEESILIKVTGIHTDFVELPDGRLLAPAWEVKDFIDDDGNTKSLLGDKIVMFDATMEPVDIWNVFDYFEPDLSVTWSEFNDTNPDGSPILDWSHLNGMNYDEEEDAIYVSLANLNSLVKIELQTGISSWVMGSSGADFTSEEEIIAFPHGVQGLSGDRLLVFNRHGISSPCSNASEISYNLEQGTAERIWSYASEECFQVLYAGNSERKENGNTLISWSTAGVLDQVDSQGNLIWRLGWPAGSGLGFVTAYDDLY